MAAVLWGPSSSEDQRAVGAGSREAGSSQAVAPRQPGAAKRRSQAWWAAWQVADLSVQTGRVEGAG